MSVFTASRRSDAVAQQRESARIRSMGRGVLAALLLLYGCASAPVVSRFPPANVPGAWLLIAPPFVHLDGGIRMDDDAPLWLWRRLAGFEDEPACRTYRDDRVVGAANDEEWAVWSMARCETRQRANGPRLVPGE